MFDIGFGEIFLIAVVALLVLGPERLPKAARFAGLWVRRARAQWYSVKAEFENELANDDLKRSLKQTRADLMEARDSIMQGGAALKQQVEEAETEVRSTFRMGNTGAGMDEDLEAPLSSVSDGFEQPELPLDDHDDVDDFADADAPEAIPPPGSGQDARR